MSAYLSGFNLPVVAFLEGGYHLEAIEASVAATLAGLAGTMPEASTGSPGRHTRWWIWRQMSPPGTGDLCRVGSRSGRRRSPVAGSRRPGGSGRPDVGSRRPATGNLFPLPQDPVFSGR